MGRPSLYKIRGSSLADIDTSAGIGIATPVAPVAPKAKPLLEMRGISKTFGSVTALQGLDAAVAPGEFVTVVGPSGCGKSTLFNIVAGLRRAGHERHPPVRRPQLPRL